MDGIPIDLLDLARQRARIEMEERHDSFNRQAQRIMEEMSARGVLRSSMTGQRVRDAIRSEIEIRVMLAWQVLTRVLSGESLPPNQAVAESAKQFVGSVVENDCGDLRSQYDQLAGLVGRAPERFDDLADRGLRKVDSEIAITLRKTRGESGSGTTINIYQPYGIVQTGEGSTATFNASVAEHKDAIGTALVAVEKALEGAPDADHILRSDTCELIQDAKRELERPQPNTLRLRSTIGGIAIAVQTLGSASAAYHLLKGAAALIGLPLP